nr:hypothetical protein [Micromonospora sp. DSM 115978]
MSRSTDQSSSPEAATNSVPAEPLDTTAANISSETSTPTVYVSTTGSTPSEIKVDPVTTATSTTDTTG